MPLFFSLGQEAGLESGSRMLRLLLRSTCQTQLGRHSACIEFRLAAPGRSSPATSCNRTVGQMNDDYERVWGCLSPLEAAHNHRKYVPCSAKAGTRRATWLDSKTFLAMLPSQDFNIRRPWSTAFRKCSGQDIATGGFYLAGMEVPG